jgi:hypothetical protein
MLKLPLANSSGLSPGRSRAGLRLNQSVAGCPDSGFVT